MLEAEYDFWKSDNFEVKEVNGQDWAGLAKGVLEAYQERLDVIQFDNEIMSGVTTVSIPGHTPGHSGFRVDSGNLSLIHLGDIMHVPNLQLIDTNISTIFDVDPETALSSRIRMLDMVSSDRTLCTSGHMIAPKFGYLENNGSSYSLVS